MLNSPYDEVKYAIMVQPLSEADGGGWLATVPALPGCMGDGDTPEAALADAEAAIVEWHAAAKQLGREVPGPGSLANGGNACHVRCMRS